MCMQDSISLGHEVVIDDGLCHDLYSKGLGKIEALAKALVGWANGYCCRVIPAWHVVTREANQFKLAVASYVNAIPFYCTATS